MRNLNNQRELEEFTLFLKGATHLLSFYLSQNYLAK